MWWYLLLILPALILLFLLLPVYLTVDLKNTEPEVKIKLAFIDITGVVIKEDKPEKETEKTEKKQKRVRKRTLSERINEFKDKVAFARDAFRIIAKRLTVTRFRLICRVATGDAAQTAVLYGSACAAAAALDAFINECFKVKKQNVYIYPDFTAQKPELDAFVKIRMFVFSAVGAGISILFNAMRRGPKRARA
ncbi:MAG: DUF2953 domain-containing protein [Clostridia bacterium]|nr:DUF2953 domain-containing protein [Clostridia bacterium]